MAASTRESERVQWCPLFPVTGQCHESRSVVPFPALVLTGHAFLRQLTADFFFLYISIIEVAYRKDVYLVIAIVFQ